MIKSVILAGAGAALVLWSAPAAAGPPGVLTACVNPGNGNLRLVGAAEPCHANESRVLWNVAGPAGPPGPKGDPGTSGGGPPFVWACAPANYHSGSSTNAAVFVFNASASTANVAVQILNKDGVNLAGVAVPGGLGALYPGETGAATVPLAASNTRIVNWAMAQGDPAAGGDVASTVKIVSDQPIVVGSNVEFSGFHPMICAYAHP